MGGWLGLGETFFGAQAVEAQGHETLAPQVMGRDPLAIDRIDASSVPVAASENPGGRGAFRDLLQTEAAGVLNLDISWCGGLSEARKIAAMAGAWYLPVAPHDCTGPVVLCAATHLSLNAPNALVQESVRAFHRGWYRDVVTALPPIEAGMITVPSGPGLGLARQPDLERRFNVVKRITRTKDV